MSIETSTDERESYLRTLGEYVADDRPRMFAIYGVYRSGRLLCGWGLEWESEIGAIFYDPEQSLTRYTVSAEHVLATYEAIADARLVWLEPSGADADVHSGAHG